MDKLQVTILEDGTIRTETDPISGPNHASAEGFLKMLAALTGGVTERKHKGHAAHHTHKHGVEHEKH